MIQFQSIPILYSPRSPPTPPAAAPSARAARPACGRTRRSACWASCRWRRIFGAARGRCGRGGRSGGSGRRESWRSCPRGSGTRGWHSLKCNVGFVSVVAIMRNNWLGSDKSSKSFDFYRAIDLLLELPEVAFQYSVYVCSLYRVVGSLPQNISLSLYRVTHHVVQNLLLTSEQKFCFALACPDPARPKRNFWFEVNRRF